MAFFGLTALGPQNCFESASIYHRTIQIFDDNDFQTAWDRVNGKIMFANKDKVHEVLKTLYRGPIPLNDVRAVDEAFEEAFAGEETISLNVYMRTMDRLRRDAEEEEIANAGKPKGGCEFISSSEFRESLKKNAAIKISPQQKLVTPLTAMQEVSLSMTFSIRLVISSGFLY